MIIGTNKRPSERNLSDGLLLYSGMQEKVIQRVGWVENPTSP
jgi:hypothetical protein